MIVLDTHAWIFLVSDPTALGKNASKAIRGAKRKAISAISCLEFAMLVEKKRITVTHDPLDWIAQSLVAHDLEILPLTPAVCVQATRLGHGFHGDPADRIIVATTLLESATLLTRDAKIREYPAVPSLW